MNSTWHPEDGQLREWLEAAREAGERLVVSQHLNSCDECLERTFGLALRTDLAAPPFSWPSLRERMHGLDAGRVQRKRRPSFRWNTWMAAAATLVIAAVVIRLSTEQTVNAAVLLRDASAAESGAAPVRNVRVRTLGVDASALPTLLRNANYVRERPLSVRAFANWRNSLRRKEDRVNILDNSEFGRERFYRVTTRTPETQLAQASITIRARDLRAVQERFTFRNDEWAEVTEAAETGDAPSLAPPERMATSREEPAVQRQITASEELKVLAALHSIGADLGDPVEVSRGTTSIEVRALAADAQRQAQIRTALSGLPYVDLRFDQPEIVRPSAPARTPEADAPKTNAVINRLISRLGGRSTVENFTNHVMDLSEAALARAHALRSLATRFPPDVEGALSGDDRHSLHSLQTDHSRNLLASVRQLTEALEPATDAAPAQSEAGSFPDWQRGTEAVLAAAQTTDRALTNALAGSAAIENPDAALQKLAEAAHDLEARAAALQTVLAKVEAQ